MKKIVSFSLKQASIDKITNISNVLGISRSKLLDTEIQTRLTPMMPLVESIRVQQKQLRVMFI